MSDTKQITVNDPVPEGSEMSSGAGRTIPDGNYVIVSELGENLYLDIPGVLVPADNSSEINIWEGHPTQGSECDVWTVTYLNNGYYKITQKGTDKALDVKGGSLKRGTRVITFGYNDWKNQQWSINELDHGYQIQSRSTGYMLDVINGDSTPGTGVQVWQGNESKAQSWGFVPFANDSRPIEDGEYYIKSAAGNAWLDAAGDWDYKSETNIQVWDSKTDIFTLIMVGAIVVS